MVKANYYNLSREEIDEHLHQMYKAIAGLKTEKEVENFFKDLLTLGELVMLARRIQIALLLLRGLTHLAIIEILEVGKTNINNVDKWLNYGFGGYRNLIKKAKTSKGYVDYKSDFAFSFFDLRNKYPAHFWLINLIIDSDKEKKKKKNKKTLRRKK